MGSGKSLFLECCMYDALRHCYDIPIAFYDENNLAFIFINTWTDIKNQFSLQTIAHGGIMGINSNL